MIYKARKQRMTSKVTYDEMHQSTRSIKMKEYKKYWMRNDLNKR